MEGFAQTHRGIDVKRKTAEELAAVTMEMFELAFSNVPEWPEGRKVMKETFREVLVKKMLPLPELSADKKSEIKHHLTSMRRVVRTDFMKIAKALPKNPGGRRKALTPERIADACRDMATLLYKGVEKSAARNRIAARYNVSPWTMGRYWREYQQAAKVKE